MPAPEIRASLDLGSRDEDARVVHVRRITPARDLPQTSGPATGKAVYVARRLPSVR